MTKLPLFAASTLSLILACSASAEEKVDKQRECDAIAEDIRRSAAARGVATHGVCSSTGPPEFKGACDSFHRCNEDLDDM